MTLAADTMSRTHPFLPFTKCHTPIRSFLSPGTHLVLASKFHVASLAQPVRRPRTQIHEARRLLPHHPRPARRAVVLWRLGFGQVREGSDRGLPHVRDEVGARRRRLLHGWSLHECAHGGKRLDACASRTPSSLIRRHRITTDQTVLYLSGQNRPVKIPAMPLFLTYNVALIRKGMDLSHTGEGLTHPQNFDSVTGRHFRQLGASALASPRLSFGPTCWVGGSRCRWT